MPASLIVVFVVADGFFQITDKATIHRLLSLQTRLFESERGAAGFTGISCLLLLLFQLLLLLLVGFFFVLSLIHI